MARTRVVDARAAGLGKWLKDRREAAGLTQKQLADALGIEYYTFVSALEAGRAKVPPERYESYARLIKVLPLDLVKHVLRAEDPHAFKIIFGGR